MSAHILAVETYGSHRVTHPTTKQKVSAYKLGYTTCGRDVLLALYGSDAGDVSSKRASYHYVRITGETAVHSGTLLLSVSDEELATVESITHAHPSTRSGCWRWLDNPGRTNHGWHRFPTAAQPDYQPPKFKEGPRYNPVGYRAVSPSGETSPASDKLHVERVQLDPDKTPWFWVGGDTYPHRKTLKAAGGRWSRKRQQWYFITETLPEAVATLVEAVNETSPTEPQPSDIKNQLEAVTETVTTVGGGEFAVGDVVQAAQDFLALGGGTITAGTLGTVSKCFGEAGELGYSYSVDFGRVGETWCFETDLAPAPDAPPPAAPMAASTPDEPPTEDDAPPAVTKPPVPDRLPGVHCPGFAVGQTVYTHARIKLDEASTVIPQGTAGTVVRRFDIRRTDKYEAFGYTVQFEDSGTHAVFERTLQDERPSAADLRFRRDEPVMIVPGGDGQSMLGMHIARREAVVNGADWDGGTDKPPSMQPEETAEVAPAPEPEPTLTSDDNPVADEDESRPTVRVMKPEALPDHLQTAVEAARGKSAKITAPTPNSTRVPIAQSYVGELTGAITGNVYCYGYSIHQGVLLYLNMGGPRTAVEAIRAKLAKGEVVNLVPWDAPAVELSAGENDGVAHTGAFTTYLHSISEAKFTSAVLVHECLTDPNYGGKSVTGIFRTDEAQAVAKLTDHVRKLVKVPVFDGWGGFLFSAGQSAGLVRSPRSGGGIDLLAVELEVDAWTRLITGGLTNGIIALPLPNVTE